MQDERCSSGHARERQAEEQGRVLTTTHAFPHLSKYRLKPVRDEGRFGIHLIAFASVLIF